MPPFAFYARLLGPLGARRAFLSRLGPEAGDALDEFLGLALAHERARAPSLAAFLADVAGLDVSIKRDMDLTSSFVRVMTVHAAKGLEAKIVFLPDVCGAPVGNHDGVLFPLARPDRLVAEKGHGLPRAWRRPARRGARRPGTNIAACSMSR